MRAFILAVTGLAIGVSACGSYGTSAVEVQKSASVAAVSITLASPSLVAGQTQRANVALKDANGVTLTNRTVQWFSSSASVATVNDSGIISGISPGAATLSAVSEGVSGQATLDVIAPPPSPVVKVLVAINPAAVVVGQTAQASATLLDLNNNTLTDRTVVWQSSNSSVATVSGSGNISALAAGVASITASSEGKTGSASLNVSAPASVPVASISVSPATATLQIGGTAQLSAVTRDASNNVLTGRVISWSSSNGSIATVSGTGLVTAVAAGSASITASSEGKTSSTAVTVNATAPVPVASVTVSPATASLQVGGSVQLAATTRDANNNVLTGRVVSWSSSNTAVSTVSASGLVSAIGAGSATITALSEAKTGVAAITVSAAVPVPVASVSVAPATATLQVGGTLQLSAVTRDASNNVLTGRVISWASSNTAVATVSSSGLVLALATGPVQITATSENQNGSATLTVSVPPPPPPGGSVEPSGMTVITERSFSAAVEDSWYFEYGQTNAAIVQDATAPHSPSGIMQLTYPAGMAGGVGPNSLERDWAAGTYRTLYVSYWMKVSSNFYGHIGPEITKTLHFWVGDGNTSGNKLYTQISGGATDPLSAWVNLQGVIAGGNFDNGTSAEFAPNLGQPATIVRGQWHRYELVMKGNSAGTRDGTLDWWLDGVHVGSYTGIQYVPGAATWSTVKWNPTWGGLGGIVPADFYETMDHIYISGKR
jgi:uncharacterized protein YjdB